MNKVSLCFGLCSLAGSFHVKLGYRVAQEEFPSSGLQLCTHAQRTRIPPDTLTATFISGKKRTSKVEKAILKGIYWRNKENKIYVCANKFITVFFFIHE